MGKYDSKLLGSEEIACATFAFHFEKPDGFEFTPGQSINRLDSRRQQTHCSGAYWCGFAPSPRLQAKP